MANLTDLIAKLERAEGGDREIDARIAAALDIRPDWLMKSKGSLEVFDGCLVWRDESFRRATKGSPTVECDVFTSSVDAAIALAEKVLPYAEEAQLQFSLPLGRYCNATLSRDTFSHKPEEAFIASAKTPAIALVLAILRAHQSNGDGK